MPQIFNLYTLTILSSLFVVIVPQAMHKRFEYRYSFKAPYLAQKDNQVPFWTYSGSAIASEESFRITPSLRSQKGQAWAKNPTSFDWWEVEVIFRVNGRGRIGADGLALWYTKVQGVEGPVFGSSDMWAGLGLFFDSFDNDNKRNNPYIMGMVNNGSIAYDHENDGATQQVGGCLRDFRNKPFPIRAKIEYYRNTLTVFIHNGMTDNDKDYEICFRAEGVILPATGHFGVTAATGGLADDHDVLKFLVHSLRSPEEMARLRVNQEDEDRFQREFDEYQQKTKKARDEYIAQNPEAGRRKEEELYETSEQRELRQIFEGQSQIYETLRQLNAKMDGLSGVVPGGSPLTAEGGAVGGGISRQEVGLVLANQKELVQGVRDMRSSVSEIQSQSGALLANSQRPQGSVQPVVGAGAGGGTYEMHVTLKELNEAMGVLKRDVGVVSQRMGGAGACPQVSCLSTAMFMALMSLQVVVLVGYFIYRDSKEAKAKKFY